MNELMQAANPEGKPMLMVDQLLPSSEIYRFMPYFDDICTVVVERDPRYVYILEKLVWKGSVIPTDDVHTFCKWYRYTRIHRKTEKYDPKRVMLIQFEDLVYRYEETTEKIRDWLGLMDADHVEKRQRFDPVKSMKNTRLWLKYDIGKDMDVIETELKEYLFDYTGLV